MRISGTLKNTASAGPPPTPTVRQLATTWGSGPLENMVTTVPPPTSPRPLAPAGRAPPPAPRPVALAGRAPSKDPVLPPPSPRPLHAGGEEGEGGKAPELALPPPGQTCRLQVLCRRDLQPNRLFSDVKFRDTWMKLEKNPTGQLREKLHKMDVSLHKRWYEKTLYHQK